MDLLPVRWQEGSAGGCTGWKLAADPHWRSPDQDKEFVFSGQIKLSEGHWAVTSNHMTSSHINTQTEICCSPYDPSHTHTHTHTPSAAAGGGVRSWMLSGCCGFSLSDLVATVVGYVCVCGCRACVCECVWAVIIAAVRIHDQRRREGRRSWRVDRRYSREKSGNVSLKLQTFERATGSFIPPSSSSSSE